MKYLLVCVLLLCPLLALAASPSGLRLEGVVLVPTRMVAEWLGAAVTAKGNTATLTRGEIAVQITWNRKAAVCRGAAVTLPAPAVELNGTSYLPTRTVVETFGATCAWEEKTTTLTLTRPDAAPLAIVVRPFPRPAAVQDDTLAGLTVGDHIALAVAKWGDPVEKSDSGMPQTDRQAFRVDPQGGIRLDVYTTGTTIVLLHTALTGKVPLKKLSRTMLQQAGSGHGVYLNGTAVPAYYGIPQDDYSHYSDDVTISNYRCGALTLIELETFFGDILTRTELTLARKGFPKSHLPMNGPLGG